MSKTDNKKKTGLSIIGKFNAPNKEAGLPIPILTGTAITKSYDAPEAPELHRQARGLMKTAGALTGRDRTQPSLFDIPRFDADIDPIKATLSKNVFITGQHLLNLWQRNNVKGVLSISNLAQIARIMRVTSQEVKLYLIYLGGYQIPITELKTIKGEKGKKDKRIFSFYHDKLFRVKFNILLKDGEDEDSFTNRDKIGTRYLSFIRDRNIASVDVTPSQSFIQELQGIGLGNVLVSDDFVALSLGLSDLAYKILCFSGSNKPNKKIRFDKLISGINLNLEKQLKSQGKPRLLEQITTALQELQDKGHLKSFDYNPTKGLFKWTYTSKVIKHKELLAIPSNKGAEMAGGTEETGQTGQGRQDRQDRGDRTP